MFVLMFADAAWRAAEPTAHAPASLLGVDVVGQYEATLQLLVQGRGQAQRRGRSYDGRYRRQRQRRRTVIHLRNSRLVAAGHARLSAWRSSLSGCT